MEEWKLIDGLDNYEVSSYGRVKSKSRIIIYGEYKRLKNSRIMKDVDNGNGYRYVTVQVFYKRKNYYIHRLVANAFLDNPLLLPQVNHKDGNKENNHYLNLEWVTAQQNSDHALKNNLIKTGELVYCHKLTKNQVIDILNQAKINPNINRSELGRKFNVADTSICRIISGKRWKGVYKEVMK